MAVWSLVTVLNTYDRNIIGTVLNEAEFLLSMVLLIHALSSLTLGNDE